MQSGQNPANLGGGITLFSRIHRYGAYRCFRALPPQDVINVLALIGATMLLLFLGVKMTVLVS
jgi:hypothetical protein